MADETTTDPTAPDATPATPAPPKRVIGRPFERNNRVNPGGRPKTDKRVKAFLARVTYPAAKEAWRMANDPKVRADVRADLLKDFMNRGLGRPMATTALANPDGSPLVPPGAPADPITERLWAAIRACAPTPEAQASTAAENVKPGAGAEAGEGIPS